MKRVFLSFFALLTIISATYVPQKNSNENGIARVINNGNRITGRGILLSSKGKKVVEDFVKQFENGYTKDEIVFGMNVTFAEIDVKIENFTVMGLDNVEIKKLSIGYTLSQSVKFNFLLPQVNISGKVMTSSLIDALSNYGVKLSGNIESNVELILENITFQGYFKYKMPLFFGSIQIYKFDASITVGNVVSRIGGLLGKGKINKFLNKAIGEILFKLVNSNEKKISTLLEKTLVPFVNSKLEGSNIWTIVG